MVEILFSEKISSRGRAMLQAMSRAIPKSVTTRKYSGAHDILMLYGPGGLDRIPIINAHLASGRHVVSWDLGYWDRNSADAMMRVSVDTLHPQRLLRYVEPDPQRFSSYGFTLRNDFNKAGPVLLIGTGRKTKAIAGDWEAEKYAELRLVMPSARIIYRPKPAKELYSIPGLECSYGCPIETALVGASLVVTKHSNVGVDAAIAGVPCVTDDGIAQSFWRGNTLKSYSVPSDKARLDFLSRVAYFQWRPSEARQAWKFIQSLLRNVT